MYIDFLNEVLHGICEELILDDKVSKLLYYNRINDEDIYSKDKVKNPVRILLNNKVFKNRKIDKIQVESDVGIAVNMSLYEPYTDYYKVSSVVKRINYDVIILCHDDCLHTINGNRTIALVEAVTRCISSSQYIKSIGSISLCQAFPVFDVPANHEGWVVRFNVDIINDHRKNPNS